MSNLSNPVKLGLHLVAGAADGYLMSADQIVDETRSQNVQTALDALFSAIGNGEHGAVSNVSVNETGTEVTVTYADSTSQNYPLKQTTIDDNLTSTATDHALSAAQGKALKDALDLLVHSIKQGNGIEVDTADPTNPVIKVKLDATSESFITVGADGIKISGVQDAINTAAGNAKSEAIAAVIGNDSDPSTADTIKGLKKLVDEKTSELNTASTLKVFNGDTEVNKISADGKDYTLKQGENTVATINIAKDMVVSEGTVILATGNEKKGTGAEAPSANLEAGKQYIKLTISNADENANILYIAADSLVDRINGSNGSKVVITVDQATNTISATIVSGSISKTDLVKAVQDSLDKADSAIQEIVAGTTNGSILVDGTEVTVFGLQSAAYKTVEQINDIVIGTAQDSSTDMTIHGTRKYVDEKVNGAPKYYKTQMAANQTSLVIEKSTHKCGDLPQVTCYMAGKEVVAGVAVEAGKVTITTNQATTAAMDIVLVGL